MLTVSFVASVASNILCTEVALTEAVGRGKADYRSIGLCILLAEITPLQFARQNLTHCHDGSGGDSQKDGECYEELHRLD